LTILKKLMRFGGEKPMLNVFSLLTSLCVLALISSTAKGYEKSTTNRSNSWSMILPRVGVVAQSGIDKTTLSFGAKEIS
jgi:hypothetical protein